MADPANPESAPAGTPGGDEALRRLEARVTRLEHYLELAPLGAEPPDGSGAEVPLLARATPAAREARATALEMRIGEFWLARVGVLALLLGLGLLIAYPFATLPGIAPCLVGAVAVAGLLLLARAWQTAYPHLARTLFGGALVLLYFATLRLHFFSNRPVIPDPSLGLALLVGLLIVQFCLAAKRRSQFLAGVVAVLCLATGLISQTAPVALGLAAATAVVVVYLLQKYNWQALANVTIVLVYLTHLLWLLNNPLLTHALRAVAEPEHNYLYLFGYAVVFAAANCFHYREPATVPARILRTILNGSGLFVLGNLVGLTFYREHLAGVDLVIHGFFLTVAILYWLHRRSRYSTSIYACFGYLALSAAIFAQFNSPDYFVWLGWQSLLVAATAVWFCSKIIIVTNLFIYLGIYLAYLAVAPANGLVNLSFALIALVTSGILDWQKNRLEIRTELIRNLYLAAAAVIIPYGLSHAVPPRWVSVSWLGAAVGYLLLSLLWRDKKYRWLAIATIFATALHTVVLDLARLEPAFRIVSFLALGLVLTLVSLLYARDRKRAGPK